MGKNKLAKFAEMETFSNVFQCTAPHLGTNADQGKMRGQWHTFFGNSNPIVLELGCGRGEYTVGLAQIFPEKNFIGIDIKGARMWAGAKEALQKGLKNVAFLRTNIEMLNHFFAENEIYEIWITFPDPQMKKATKRLTSTYFLDRYQHLLVNNGIIHLKTDSPFLYQYTSAVIRENKFVTLCNTNDLYHSGINDDILSLRTHYEKQWLERGMTIKYIKFQLLHSLSYAEPTEEFEKDTYRSYGRNYATQP